MSCYPGLDLNLWPSGELLHFAPIFLHRQGSRELPSSAVKAWPRCPVACFAGGGGIRSQVQPLWIWGEGEHGRFPSWGKGLVMQLGKNETKQLLFPSGSERVCDVKVEPSLPKDYRIFFFLFWGVGLGDWFTCFFGKSLKQCCFPFLGAIVPCAADSLPSPSSPSWEALSWWCVGSALIFGLLSFVLLRSLLFFYNFCLDPHHRVHKNRCFGADGEN